jgi:hypothetical protein
MSHSVNRASEHVSQIVTDADHESFDKVQLDGCREYLDRLRNRTLPMSRTTVGEMRDKFEWLVKHAYTLYWRVEQVREKMVEQEAVVRGLRSGIAKRRKV